MSLYPHEQPPRLVWTELSESNLLHGKQTLLAKLLSHFPFLNQSVSSPQNRDDGLSLLKSKIVFLVNYRP